ncbi:MAG: Gfo/Idh/MocA family oxidoreductase [Pegethrix bostrychoides GSE-TBD4-15B]|jgi:predicted dehydrogenase|uniref:Gfo/Idh/MocA family oxidoreductase n=1 Tax=Pegethrix bostrychoides GSE-TBD4-15B TaxID=2839662 RepID=A0A951U6D1_9CYAN|nr:Gfo/Idh/MocA family oxidoreductase [Pegethrix bostrychoides GSE-TBD4-15B]
MRIAIVGCGFVADYYLKTLPNYPELELVGVTDRVKSRLEHFSNYHKVPSYDSVQTLLADSSVELVLNLTNPRSHYEVSKAALEAGKHVYSEKPLAMAMAEAEELVKLAEQQQRLISSAPCSLLGETAQTLWKALREQKVGQVRLVYAEMDDGLVHRMPYKNWVSESGIPWPYKDEFEVGCTLEHAGYYVTWLTAFFGPAETVTAFSACLVPDKETDVPLEVNAPDFSVACIKFASGVVARLTCGIVAPHDHELRIIGDEGVLGIEDCWYYGSPVYIKRMVKIRRKTFMSPWKQNYPLVRKPIKFGYKGSQQMDFARGVAELAAAVRENRPCRISSQFSLHNNELVLAIQNALETGAPYKLTTSFDPVEPMPWAK